MSNESRRRLFAGIHVASDISAKEILRSCTPLISITVFILHIRHSLVNAYSLFFQKISDLPGSKENLQGFGVKMPGNSVVFHSHTAEGKPNDLMQEILL